MVVITISRVLTARPPRSGRPSWRTARRSDSRPRARRPPSHRGRSRSLPAPRRRRPGADWPASGRNDRTHASGRLTRRLPRGSRRPSGPRRPGGDRAARRSRGADRATRRPLRSGPTARQGLRQRRAGDRRSDRFRADRRDVLSAQTVHFSSLGSTAPPTRSTVTTVSVSRSPARSRIGSQGSPAGPWQHRRPQVALRARKAVTHDQRPARPIASSTRANSDDVGDVSCDRGGHHVGWPPPRRRRPSQQRKQRERSGHQRGTEQCARRGLESAAASGLAAFGLSPGSSHPLGTCSGVGAGLGAGVGAGGRVMTRASRRMRRRRRR